jgi:hypothetical protein
MKPRGTHEIIACQPLPAPNTYGHQLKGGGCANWIVVDGE